MKDLNLYGGKYKLVFQEKAHRYKVNGEFKQGVTTILKLLDKGESLLQWASNCAVEAMLAGESPELAKKAFTKRRDSAGDVGTRVHAWIEAYTSGNTLPIEKDTRKAIDAYLRWEEENDITHISSERVVYSEKYDFCGTCDDVHESNGLRVVNDYKTGKPDFEYSSKTRTYTGRVKPRIEHLLQCALYDQAMYEEDAMLDPDNAKYADKYAVTYITKEGKLYFFESDRTEQLREVALQVVKTYQLLKLMEFKNEYRSIENE